MSTGGGSLTFGDHLVNNTFYLTSPSSGDGSSDAPFGPDDVAILRCVRVATDSEEELARRLGSDDRVVLLRGQENSGRQTAALCALAEVGSPTEDRPLTLVRSATSLGALAERVDGDASGYLLDATGMGWLGEVVATDLAKLWSALGEHDAYLVVLIDEDDHAGQTRLHSVAHRPPDREAVFERNLARLLLPRDSDTLTRSDIDTAVAGRVARLLAQVREVPSVESWRQTFESPADAYALAHLLAEETERGAAVYVDALDDRVDEARAARLRSLAQDLLRDASAAHSPVDQAYVIAAAVLDGCRLSTVIDAAENLAERLQKAELPEGKWRRRTFARPLARRLRHVDTEQRDAMPDTDDAKDTFVTLKQPQLRNVIVDVVWNEYEAARHPLRDWLVQICEVSPWEFQGDALNVQIGVDFALTRLAQHDFEQLATKVLDPWARRSSPFTGPDPDRSERQRDIARLGHCSRVVAWVMEHLVVSGVQRTRALGRLADWMRDNERVSRHTAVLAYGTRIAEIEPVRVFTTIKGAFQRLDHDLSTSRGNSAESIVAAALEGAYDAGMRYRSLYLLTQEAPQSPASTWAAVRALLQVAELRKNNGATQPRGEQPDLLAWLDDPYLAPGDRPESGGPIPDVEELTAGIARLWAIALAARQNKDLNRKAWNALHRWDQLARSPQTGTPGLRGRVNRILHRLRARPELQEQIEHYEQVRERIAAHRRTGPGETPEKGEGDNG